MSSSSRISRLRTPKMADNADLGIVMGKRPAPPITSSQVPGLKLPNQAPPDPQVADYCGKPLNINLNEGKIMISPLTQTTSQQTASAHKPYDSLGKSQQAPAGTGDEYYLDLVLYRVYD